MPSAVAKGSYYKARAKKWLEKQGFTVAHLEQMRIVYPPGRRPFGIKKDQFGSDLLAVDRQRIWFVQVKLGTKNVAAGRTEFAKWPCPPSAQQVLLVWLPKAREPRLEFMPALDISN